MASNAKARKHGTGSIWAEQRKGYRVWIGQVRVNGRQFQKTLGTKRARGAKDGLTQGEAERTLREFRADIEERVANEAASAKDEKVLLSVVAEERFVELELVEGRREWTVDEYRKILGTHLIPFFGDVPLTQITTAQVEVFIRQQLTEGNARRRGEGLTTGTVAKHVNVLGAIFRLAMRRGLVDSNPVAAAKKPRASTSSRDIHFLTADQVETLVRAAPDTDLGRTDAAIFLTAAMTGLRRGELVALRWRDVDWGAGRIRVRGSRRRGLTSDPKSEKSKRAVPMSMKVAGELDRHFKRSRCTDDDDPVFCNPDTGKHLDPDALSSRFRAARDRAGLPKVRFHDLRHTFGTLMAAEGADVRLLKEWMGHEDIQTTMVYTHYAPRADESAMIDRAFAKTTADAAQLTAVADC